MKSIQKHKCAAKNLCLRYTCFTAAVTKKLDSAVVYQMPQDHKHYKQKFQTDFDKENSDGEIFFDLLGGDGVYWYMFAMAAFMGLCYLLRNSRPWAVLTASMVTALAAGYDPSVGDENELSRIVVFFPFYYCGYVLDPEKVADFVKKWYVRVLSLGVIGIWAYFCFGKTKLVYPLRMLLTGRNSYFSISEATDMDCTFLSRLLVMGISALLCLAVLGIGLDVKIPLKQSAAPGLCRCTSGTGLLFICSHTMVIRHILQRLFLNVGSFIWHLQRYLLYWCFA